MAQRTHHYHPITKVTAAWAEVVKAEQRLAEQTPAERAAKDDQRERAAVHRETVWTKTYGGGA